MVIKIKEKLISLIVCNAKSYILLCAIFVAGATLALLCNMGSLQEEELRLYFYDYIYNVSNSGMDPAKTFYLAMMHYGQFAVCVLFCAITIVGAPLIFILILINGFSFGTAFCCIIKAFGLKAFLIFFCTILPHTFITLPCCLGYGLHCIKRARKLTTGNISVKYNLLTPLGFGILFLCAMSAAALIQAYIEPLLIKIIAPYF